MSAEENQSEFLFLQVHVIPTISEKSMAFVELKKRRDVTKNDLASAGSSEQKAAQILVFCIIRQTLRSRRNTCSLEASVSVMSCAMRAECVALSRFSDSRDFRGKNGAVSL